MRFFFLPGALSAQSAGPEGQAPRIEASVDAEALVPQQVDVRPSAHDDAISTRIQGILSVTGWFELTSGGSMRHRNSGLCVHPRGGSATPGAETELVLWDICDEPRLRFQTQ